MALYKRGNIYWISINHQGKRVQRSTKTSDKLAALELHDQIKANLWQQVNLGKKARRYWIDAVMRWLNESTHKKSLRSDKVHLRWLDPYLRKTALDEITREVIDEIAQTKASTGVTNATINRMLALIRTILNKAVHEWEWLDKAPSIKLRVESGRRVRWLTHEEANRLLNELPPHLSDLAEFSLATGLRMSNATGLKWQDVDLDNGHAWIHHDQAKSNRAIPVPLNQQAIAVLKRRQGIDKIYVFTYCGHAIKQCNTKAWRNALQRAGIEDFRWHDIRHYAEFLIMSSKFSALPQLVVNQIDIIKLPSYNLA